MIYFHTCILSQVFTAAYPIKGYFYEYLYNKDPKHTLIGPTDQKNAYPWSKVYFIAPLFDKRLNLARKEPEAVFLDKLETSWQRVS